MFLKLHSRTYFREKKSHTFSTYRDSVFKVILKFGGRARAENME